MAGLTTGTLSMNSMKHIISFPALCFLLSSCERPAANQADTTFTQEGVTEVRGFEPIDVYYPVPFGSTPNLSFPKREYVNFQSPTEQRPDGFRIKVDGYGPGAAKFHWKAEGLRAKTK